MVAQENDGGILQDPLLSKPFISLPTGVHIRGSVRGSLLEKNGFLLLTRALLRLHPTPQRVPPLPGDHELRGIPPAPDAWHPSSVWAIRM